MAYLRRFKFSASLFSCCLRRSYRPCGRL